MSGGVVRNGCGGDLGGFEDVGEGSGLNSVF